MANDSAQYAGRGTAVFPAARTTEIENQFPMSHLHAKSYILVYALYIRKAATQQPKYTTMSHPPYVVVVLLVLDYIWPPAIKWGGHHHHHHHQY